MIKLKSSASLEATRGCHPICRQNGGNNPHKALTRRDAEGSEAAEARASAVAALSHLARPVPLRLVRHGAFLSRPGEHHCAPRARRPNVRPVRRRVDPRADGRAL